MTHVSLRAEGHGDRPVTVVSRAESAPERPWLTPPRASRRLLFVESFDAIRAAFAHDVHRARIDDVIIDGTATGAEYLHFLCTLPAAYRGDVLLLLDDSAFLSSGSADGDRALHALPAAEAQAYVETRMLAEAATAAAA
jgi:hypothetical protein